MAVGVARVILLGLFGPVLCLTDVQTSESSGKKGSWVGRSRTLLGPREPREWGPDSRDSGNSDLEALTPGLREEGLGTWTLGSEGAGAGGLDPWVWGRRGWGPGLLGLGQRDCVLSLLFPSSGLPTSLTCSTISGSLLQPFSSSLPMSPFIQRYFWGGMGALFRTGRKP